jgi:hypothetical protein
MFRRIRKALATMLYPDVLGDVEVKPTFETFDKNGWIPWPSAEWSAHPNRPPRGVPIELMRDGWEHPSWVSGSEYIRGEMNAGGLWWRYARPDYAAPPESSS